LIWNSISSSSSLRSCSIEYSARTGAKQQAGADRLSPWSSYAVHLAFPFWAPVSATVASVKFAPTALAVAATVLVVPVLTGYAAQADGPPRILASSFDATTITTLAANGVELAAADDAPDPGPADLDASTAVAAAERALGGDARTAFLGAFTDHNAWDAATGTPLSRDLAWQVVLDDTVLPSGERGLAWVSVDAQTGEVLAAHPLMESSER